jgi:hypothetical protein
MQQMWMDAEDANYAAITGQGSILKYVNLQPHSLQPNRRRVPIPVAAYLLRLWVRIPPGAWMLSLVSAVICQVEDCAKS